MLHLLSKARWPLALAAWACACVPTGWPPTPASPAVIVERSPEPGRSCAELVEPPRTVLDGRVSLRLPSGLEPAVSLDHTEYFEAGPAELPCVDGRALVRMTLSMRPENRDYMLIDFRDDALSVLRYPYGMKIRTLVEDEVARELVSIIDVSTDATATQIGNRVYMRVFKAESTIYVLTLEAAPADFEALRPTFEAVAHSAVGVARGQASQR